MKDYSKIIASLSPEKRALLEKRLKQQGSSFNAFPLSFSQQRLWFLEQLEPGNAIYNLPSAVRLVGTLDLEVLSTCIHRIVQRHEILRTTFQTVNGEAMQVVAPELKIELPVVDLQATSEDAREAEIKQLAAEEARQPFDLARGPLFRTKLIRLKPDEHIILFTMHHIISDGWSIGVLNREIAVLYDALVNGKPVQLPELPIQYADYAQWQRKRLTGEAMDSLLDYWKQQLGDDLPVLELPTDHPRPAVQTYNGQDVTFTLSKQLTDRLIQLSRDHHATLFMTLVAAFQTLLARYSGQNDVCVGTPIANRTRAEVERLIGFFVNTLVIRTKLTGNPSFKELLARVREVTLGAYAHQELPFEKLVEVLQPARDMSHTPLFQVMFILQNTPLQPLKLPSLTMSPILIESKTAEFDLTLSMTEMPDGLWASLQYNSDLFEAATIQRIIRHFQNLLEAIVTNPDERILNLPLMSPAEQQKVTLDWNKTQTEFPSERSIQQLIEEQVARTPDAIAVVAGDRSLSYRELNRRANQLAGYLQRMGVGPEKLIGICIDRSLEMIVGLLGILKAGGAYVPLDPNYPQERLEYIIADSNVSVLLTQSQFVSRLPRRNAQIICLDTDWVQIESLNDGPPAELVGSDHLAYIIYTSGSTGKPKGVLVSHKSVINHNTEVIKKFRLRAEDRILQFATINFDAAVEEIFPALMCGATLVLRPGGGLLSGMELLQFIEQENLTVLDLPTVFWHEWVHELSVLKRKLPPSLRLVVIGGDKASAERVALWQQLVAGDVSLINTYGPTETTVISTLSEIDQLYARQGTLPVLPIGRPIANTQIYLLDANLQPVPVGVPGELCIGGVGLARGYLNRPDLTAEKFIPNPFAALSGERLYRTGDLARYLPDGNIDFIGRVDNQVKIRGFRVELTEVESVLAKHPLLHEVVTIADDIENRPGEKRLVAYCVPVFSRSLMKDDKRRHVRVPFFNEAVIGLNGSKPIKSATEDLSHGGARLLTISPMPNYDQIQRVSMALNLPIVPEQVEIESDIIWQRENHVGLAFRNLTPDHQKILDETILSIVEDQNMLVKELRQFAHQNLPEYMVPQVFVILDEIPKTPSGKVDRRALPKPDLTRPELGGAYVAPRTAIEELLAGIWASIFGVERIGIYDNFFELGGHSLMATQFISRVRNVFQVELPLKTIFETPTIAGLAEKIAAIREDVIAAAPPIRPIPRAGNMPLSFGQQRLWFLDQLEPNSPEYNVPDAVRITGKVDVAALHKSIQTMVERHEILRTTFETVDGTPYQKIHNSMAVPLPIVDLQELPAAIQESYSKSLLIDEAKRPFDLSTGPLLRTTLLRLGAEDHIILLVMHHIVSDGWSTSVFIKELAALYDAYASGLQPQLPALPFQYADFACWQRNWLKGEVLQNELDYWKQQLAGGPAMLELPTDFPRPPVQTNHGSHQTFALESELSTALMQLSRQEGATLFMTLLGAFHILLARYSGQPVIQIGTPIANRDRSETENLIGFFVNTLVLRLDTSDNPSFRKLLERIKKVTLEAYAHQHVPFEKVVDAVQPERDLSRSPLFQVMFVMQNNPRSELKLKGLTFSAIELDTGISNFDLTLTMGETESGLGGALEYNTDLFKPTTIARMIEHFKTLLKALVATPDQPVSQVSMMPPSELQQVIYEWNNIAADFPLDRCIHQLIEKQAGLSPDALAVIGVDQTITYRELNQRANQLANYLRKKGVAPERLVGLCLKRSVEMIVGMLGILKAGAAYLPLDPNYPTERLEYMIQDSQVALIVTQQDLINSIPSAPAELICLDRDWDKIGQENTADLENVARPLNQAYVIYTSGSTGKPKGVQVAHQSVVNHNLAVVDLFGLRPGDRVLQFATINFDTAVEEIFPALMSGAAIVLRQSDDVILSGEQLIHMIKTHQLTVLDLPTAYWQEWVYGLTLMQQELPDSLRLVVVGGDKVAAEKYVLWKRMVGSRIRWLNTYGPTEGTVIAAAYDPEDQLSPYQEGMEMPIGRPIANGKLHILDANWQPVPIGVPGELVIGGQCVARGYLNRPDLTAEKFIPDPFSRAAGARLYRTGDRARYLPDGNIEFLGRVDHQVKIRGFRVELGEIETTLRQFPFVREAVVIVREDSPGNKRLLAYCALADKPATIANERRRHARVPFKTEAVIQVAGLQTIEVNIIELSETGARCTTTAARQDWSQFQNMEIKLNLPELSGVTANLIWHNDRECGIRFIDLSDDQQRRIRQLIASAKLSEPNPQIKILRDYLKEKLPDYMMPSAIVIVDEFPKTPSGKIDRKALPEPTVSGSIADSESGEPQTPMEIELAAIWQEVLGINRVGVNDNFFELGGDSILTIQVISRAQKKGLYLTPKQFFQTPTIAGLANYLTYHAAENKIEAEQGTVTGQVPLTPIQHWFFEQEFAAPHHYNQSLFFEVREPLDRQLLRQAIGHLYAHHDALRLRFRRQNGNWEQYHADIIDEAPFEVHDLSAADANEQQKLIEEQTHRLQASLDLEQGPLMRVALFELGVPNGQRLLIVVHHLAVDGVSWRILLEDLQSIYQQLKLGQPVQLPSKTTSYKYWAERLTQLAQADSLQAEQSYWLGLVNKAVSRLPLDNPAGENLEQSERNVVVTLSREETGELLREVPATYHTQINDILLTALVQAHYRMTGSRTLLIDLEGHGREHLFDEVDLSRTVGWFTSVYPVLLDLKLTRNSGDAAKTIKEQLRQIPQNGIGYGLLRYLSAKQELTDRLKTLPAAQISFNYLGQFDQVANESHIFNLARESKGPEIDPKNHRNYLIDISGSIAGGKLQVEFKYSANLHRSETIERFANYFLSELQGIIAHCKSSDAGGFTPSDFTLAKLNQKKLDKVLQKLNKKKERVG